MFQSQIVVEIKTSGPGLHEFTPEVARFVRGSGVGMGILTAFCRHTSCSLLIQENADPDVRQDLDAFFKRLAPEGMDWVTHTTEGPDDMPAHIKAALTPTMLSIPITRGVPVLGQWQGIYLFEHRRHPHVRQVVLHILGDGG